MEIIKTQTINNPTYYSFINVFDVGMILNVSYNSRSNCRYISLTSLDETVLYLKPTKIEKDDIIYFNFNMSLTDLNVYVCLGLKDDVDLKSDDYLNWDRYYDLCFVSYDILDKGLPFKHSNLKDDITIDTWKYDDYRSLKWDSGLLVELE